MLCQVGVGRIGLLALVAAAVLVTGVAPVLAQGLYYREIVRDGRIYVFNVAANAERFETSGEMRVSITKPGSGPNGETVIGDNERALQLFFFKHGISEPVPDPPAPPPPAPPYKFSGLVFGDYYYFAQHHDSKWETQQGFWMRRVYLTFDYTFTPQLTTRFRLEANSNGTLSGGAITPYVKDAYLRWTYTGRQHVTLGIQPTPIIEFGDAFWGLRHIEKTPLDLYQWDSSRDFAVTGAGPLNKAGTVKYVFQFGNESGTQAELNTSKAIRAALRYETPSGVTLQGNVSRFHHVEHADWVTAEAQAGYRHARGRAGVEYAYQFREHGDVSATPDLIQRVVSVFGVVDPKPQKLSVFARLDFYQDPCPTCAGLNYLPIDPSAPFTFGLAGVEFYVHPSVRFSPNVEWVSYGTPAKAGVAAPKNDLVARATFFWTW